MVSTSSLLTSLRPSRLGQQAGRDRRRCATHAAILSLSVTLSPQILQVDQVGVQLQSQFVHHPAAGQHVADPRLVDAVFDHFLRDRVVQVHRHALDRSPGRRWRPRPVRWAATAGPRTVSSSASTSRRSSRRRIKVRNSRSLPVKLRAGRIRHFHPAALLLAGPHEIDGDRVASCQFAVARHSLQVPGPPVASEIRSSVVPTEYQSVWK